MGLACEFLCSELAMFNVCCICSCQRFQILPVSLFLSPLSSGLPHELVLEQSKPWRAFSCNPLVTVLDSVRTWCTSWMKTAQRHLPTQDDRPGSVSFPHEPLLGLQSTASSSVFPAAPASGRQTSLWLSVFATSYAAGMAVCPVSSILWWIQENS